ncbi:MAG: DUF1972 domain-containing protein [Salibacteraceae bacterium]
MKTKKNVAIIGTVGVPACYGGFETLAEQLVSNNDGSQNITVYCSGKKYPKEKRTTNYKNAKLVYIPLEANGIQSILYDTISIIHALFFSDVLLVLGVAGAWLFPLIRLLTNKKIIVSIDGIEWKRDKWSRLAKWYLWWAEKMAVRYSHLDISDNESIQDYTAMRYGTLSNIIEYGADHASKVQISKSDIKIYPFLAKPYAFKVCRIEPENNIHVVLDAFAHLPEYPLVMVGNWKNSQYGLDLKKRYGEYKNINLLDPIYDQTQLDLLRSNCFLYVHGHSAGGTNPSLVEAMFLGLPILSFGVSYNRTTTDHKAFYFKDSVDIQWIIKDTKLVEFKAQGKLMKEIAENRYTWKIVSAKYNFLVKKALEMDYKKSAEPELKRFDEQELRTFELNHLSRQQLFFQN